MSGVLGEDDPPVVVQQAAKAAQDLGSVLDAGDVVEGERREDEVECPGLEPAVVAIADEQVPAVRVRRFGQVDHGRRDVDPDGIEAKLAEEPRRTAGAAAEIEGGASTGRARR